MKAIPIERYSPGGDIYERIAAQYGRSSAQSVYQAALTGDRAAITDAMARVGISRGPDGELNTSTASILWGQLSTNPLAAPLDSANRQIGTAVKELFKNPWVVAAVAGGLFLYFGGGDWIKKQVALK